MSKTRFLRTLHSRKFPTSWYWPIALPNRILSFEISKDKIIRAIVCFWIHGTIPANTRRAREIRTSSRPLNDTRYSTGHIANYRTLRQPMRYSFRMEYRFNTEREVKFVTDSKGLAKVEKWLKARLRIDLGLFRKSRNHYYFDREDFLLARSGVSFRQAVGKTTYCLKYPIGMDGKISIRREVFTRCPGYQLDIRNPFHQRAPVFYWLGAHLFNEQDTLEEALNNFQPRIRVECSRTWRIIPRADDSNWMLGIAFDHVKAFLPEKKNDFFSWCEVEFEPTNDFPTNLESAKEFAEQLSNEGLSYSSKSKYQVAADYLLNSK